MKHIPCLFLLLVNVIWLVIGCLVWGNCTLTDSIHISWYCYYGKNVALVLTVISILILILHKRKHPEGRGRVEYVNMLVSVISLVNWLLTYMVGLV